MFIPWVCLLRWTWLQFPTSFCSGRQPWWFLPDRTGTARLLSPVFPVPRCSNRTWLESWRFHWRAILQHPDPLQCARRNRRQNGWQLVCQAVWDLTRVCRQLMQPVISCWATSWLVLLLHSVNCCLNCRSISCSLMVTLPCGSYSRLDPVRDLSFRLCLTPLA